MEEEEIKKRIKPLKIIAFLCVLVGGILIFIDGYYWMLDSTIGFFMWSGAKVMPDGSRIWGSPTGHIPISYWGIGCGVLVIFGAILMMLPREDLTTIGSVLGIVFSVAGLVASGGWMAGFVMGVIGGLLSLLFK